MNISRNEILRWSGWWWTEVFKVRHACSYDFYNAWQSSSSFRFRFYTSSLFQFFDLLCNFFFFSSILIWAFNALTSAESFFLPLFFTGAGKLGLDACMQLWIFVSKIFSAMTMAMSIYRTLCVLVFQLSHMSEHTHYVLASLDVHLSFSWYHMMREPDYFAFSPPNKFSGMWRGGEKRWCTAERKKGAIKREPKIGADRILITQEV